MLPFRPEHVWQIPQVSRHTGGDLRETQGESISTAYVISSADKQGQEAGLNNKYGLLARGQSKPVDLMVTRPFGPMLHCH